MRVLSQSGGLAPPTTIGANDMATDNRKIDIYLLNRTHKCWQYECSTTWSKTCKEAKSSFLRRHDYLDAGQVKARFA
jgi:hypothetical protein